MEEKILTDEQVLNTLERLSKQTKKCFPKYGNIYEDALDLIHRLQENYLKLKEKYVKVLDLNEKVITEQKAEIERLENERTYLQMVADAFKGDYKNAKADGVRELLQELIEMEIKLDPLRSGIRYKALIGYAEENGIEVE